MKIVSHAFLDGSKFLKLRRHERPPESNNKSFRPLHRSVVQAKTMSSPCAALKASRRCCLSLACWFTEKSMRDSPSSSSLRSLSSSRTNRPLLSSALVIMIFLLKEDKLLPKYKNTTFPNYHIDSYIYRKTKCSPLNVLTMYRSHGTL